MIRYGYIKCIKISEELKRILSKWKTSSIVIICNYFKGEREFLSTM